MFTQENRSTFSSHPVLALQRRLVDPVEGTLAVLADAGVEDALDPFLALLKVARPRVVEAGRKRGRLERGDAGAVVDAAVVLGDGEARVQAGVGQRCRT